MQSMMHCVLGLICLNPSGRLFLTSLGSQVTHVFPKSDANNLIQVIKMLEHKLGEMSNLSDKSSFSKPNRSLINTIKS